VTYKRNKAVATVPKGLDKSPPKIKTKRALTIERSIGNKTVKKSAVL
jgi:hypothetical protein